MNDAAPIPGYASMAPPAVAMERRADGAIVLTCPAPLGPYPERLGDWLLHWASETPDAVFLAERIGIGEGAAPGRWRRLTYGEAADLAARVGTRLLRQGLSAAHPLMVLGENSVDQALAMLGAYLAGVPVAPVSTGYAERGRDTDRLASIYQRLGPGLVLIGDRARFGDAVAAVGAPAERVVDLQEIAAGFIAGAAPGPALDAHRRVTSGHIAKILFSSGSTGTPKGILNTHCMLCSNQAALAGRWPFLDEEKPLIVDWLPWNHTFGGNHNFHLVLRAGGTFYIDAGKPVPGLIETTVANLKELSPTVYFNVPRGYDLLAGALEADDDLARSFFKRLVALHYAGAGLPRAVFDRLDALALRHRGHGIPIGTGWGTTETAPLATMTFFPGAEPPNIGLPVPGVTIKLAPSAGRLELRVKGPNVTPGYLQAPDIDAEAFDDEGFFQTGDAGLLADPARPAAGLLFDGRLAENFKLDTGSWVNVGALRLAVLTHLSPLIQDCVVAGEGRGDIGLLLFPNWQACAAEAGTDDADPNAVAAAAALRRAIAARLAAYNDAHPAATTRIARALVVAAPPSLDAGEITDKGYLNQRAVLNARADDVAALYSDDARVVTPATT